MLALILVALFAALFTGAIIVNETGKQDLVEACVGYPCAAVACVWFANVATYAAGFESAYIHTHIGIALGCLPAMWAIWSPLAMCIAMRRGNTAHQKMCREVAKLYPCPRGWESVEA